MAFLLLSQAVLKIDLTANYLLIRYLTYNYNHL